MEHEAHFAFGYLPTSTGGLSERPRAEFGTKIGRPPGGEELGSLSVTLWDGPSDLETIQENTKGNNELFASTFLLPQ